jgi:subtilisin family serine protease
MLSVAATDDRDKLASFSNYGKKSVDMAAPGDHIASTYVGSEYVYMSGTSMAAPYVAAAAAMLREKGNGLKSLSGKTASGRRLNVNVSLG